MVKEVAASRPVTLVNSINPYRLEGQKTAAFEVVDPLGRAPDYHLIPVGNAGNITAYWRGYGEYVGGRARKTLPRMAGFQAAGAAPLVESRVIDEPGTLATAIRIGNPASWQGAVTAVRESERVDRRGDRRGDPRRVPAPGARRRGSSWSRPPAPPWPGSSSRPRRDRLESGATCVLTLTGHGLKDPESALGSATRPVTVPPRLDAVLGAMTSELQGGGPRIPLGGAGVPRSGSQPSPSAAVGLEAAMARPRPARLTAGGGARGAFSTGSSSLPGCPGRRRLRLFRPLRCGSIGDAMALLVQKYGGSSVADPDRIRGVARRAVETVKAGHRVVVVVSAMGKTTDGLIRLAREVTETPSERELDVVLATGEQVSIALLAMAIEALGQPARSFTGPQAGIRTDAAHTRARILEIGADQLRRALDEGRVAVVAGFQGVSEGGELTTLGRGGSDLTAVALAAALRADVCEIYTDVDGVYTADPNVVPDARKLPRVSYDEMLEMASLGAKVLQSRSVEFAKRYGVPRARPLHVQGRPRDAGHDGGPEHGIRAGDQRDARPRARQGVDPAGAGPAGHRRPDLRRRGRPRDGRGHDRPEHQPGRLHRHLLHPAPDRPRQGRRGALRGGAPDRRRGGRPRRSRRQGLDRGHRHAEPLGVAARMFQTLSREGINIQMISTSEIAVSCVIEDKYTELAVRALHDTFELATDRR